LILDTTIYERILEKYGDDPITFHIPDGPDLIEYSKTLFFECQNIGGVDFAIIRPSGSSDILYLHDLVQEALGFIQKKDYEYLLFLNSFSAEEITTDDYDWPHTIEPPVIKRTPLDCREANLQRVTREDLRAEEATPYLGIIKEKGKWRPVLTSAENNGKGRLKGSRYYDQEIAARNRDILILENGNSSNTKLNYPKEDYYYSFITGGSDLYDSSQCVEVPYQTAHDGYGYRAFLNLHNNFNKPTIVSNTTYETEEEAQAVCDKYIRDRFGPLSKGIYKKSKYISSQKLGVYCCYCGQRIVGGSGVVESLPRLKVACTDCYTSHHDWEPDLPVPEKILPKDTVVTLSYKTCKRCKQRKLFSSAEFPTYQYKGEFRLLGTCKKCKYGKE
jgi:hypothetical protein